MDVVKGTYWKSKRTGKIVSVFGVYDGVEFDKAGNTILVKNAHCMQQGGRMLYIKVSTLEKSYVPSTREEMFPQKQSPSFSNWLETFVSEKGYDKDYEFTVETESNVHFVSLGAVMEQMKVATDNERKDIQLILRKIDFANGDAMHFFAHMAKAVAEMYEKSTGGL